MIIAHTYLEFKLLQKALCPLFYFILATTLLSEYYLHFINEEIGANRSQVTCQIQLGKWQDKDILPDMKLKENTPTLFFPQNLTHCLAHGKYYLMTQMNELILIIHARSYKNFP